MNIKFSNLSPEVTHGMITKKLLEMGYRYEENRGVCGGLTMMWVQAHLAGPQGEQAFLNRLSFICNTDTKTLLNDINQVKNKIKNRELDPHQLNEQQQKLLEVEAFLMV